jgi:hypothetical protein
MLVISDRESFEGGLTDWNNKWKGFLNDFKTNANGRLRYTHKKLKSTY